MSGAGEVAQSSKLSSAWARGSQFGPQHQGVPVLGAEAESFFGLASLPV